MKSTSQPTPQNRKTLVIVIGIVIIVLAIVAVWFVTMYHHTATSGDVNNAAEQSKSQASGAQDLSKINAAQLVPPANMGDFTDKQPNTANFDYYYNGDKSCNFGIGTVSATQLPGKDLGEIVTTQLQTYRKNGVSATNPQAGTPLKLKSSDGKTTYSMPTLTFEFVQSGKKIESRYSAAVLGNGDRLVISRVCDQAHQSLLGTLDALANKVTVTVN